MKKETGKKKELSGECESVDRLSYLEKMTESGFVIACCTGRKDRVKDIKQNTEAIITLA